MVLNLLNDHTAQTTVRILKPSAIVGAESAEVEVTRSLLDFKINSAVLGSSVAPDSSLAKRGSISDKLLASGIPGPGSYQLDAGIQSAKA